MTKRKAPRITPEFPYGLNDEKSSIGEIVLEMATNFVLERLKHVEAGNVNKLALRAIHNREKEFIRQVNAAFAEQVASAVAVDNRGKGGARAKKRQWDETHKKVKLVIQSLKKDKKDVTANSIAKRWGSVIVSEEPHPTERQLQNHLKTKNLEVP